MSREHKSGAAWQRPNPTAPAAVPATPPRTHLRVLPTLNTDGSRRQIRPRAFEGRFWRARRPVALGLILLFTGLPFLHVAGKPAVLLDIAAREFTFFGTTFRATDGVLLMLALLTIFVGIFLVTAWVGRAWCGWACPQTVYMEFLFRPLERWLEGGLNAQKQLDRNGPNWRRALKYGVFALLALGLAHVFLAYFVGLERLVHWVTRSPFEHPSGFLVVGTTALLIFADFGYFREQMCTIACPYARLQAALLDPSSLIIGYDRGRGEPRGRGEQKGDCVDCGACVVACPTGIDIREGLQLECIACAQCVDACDSVMLKFHRPLGLIRYAATHHFSDAQHSLLPRRGRVAVYALLLGGLLTALAVYGLQSQRPEIMLLRGLGAPFQVQDGRVQNQIRIKIENHETDAVSYQLELEHAPDAQLVAPENPIRIVAGGRTTTSVFVTLPVSAFHSDSLDLTLVFRDAHGKAYERPYRLLGPGRAGP
jgi:cytochrome c oxidase accessory protein FixG